MNELVSIIMPAYQCEATVEESIRSVLSQTYQSWELIIVDDASTDGTPAILTRLVTEDSRIRVITLKYNGGVAAARNHGAKSALGKWIAFLDSDDIWLPEKLEKQLSLAEKSETEFIYSGAACIDSHSQTIGRVFQVPASVSYHSLLHGNDLICSTIVLRTELFLLHPMERSDLHEDYICWLSILQEGTVAYGIQEPLILYRITAASKSGNKLKSASMAWRTFRYIGLNSIHATWCFLHYIIHGVIRYWL